MLGNLRFLCSLLVRTPTRGGKPAVFYPFLSEPRPKEENATVFLLWTPPFPFEYWVIPWPTDAKGTDLIDRVASSSDRRDGELPSRSVETPFCWLHGCQSSRSTPDSGALGARLGRARRFPTRFNLGALGVWRLVVARLAFVDSVGLSFHDSLLLGLTARRKTTRFC